MLVGELAGRIEVLSPPYTTPDPNPFLQLTNVGEAGVQQGLYDIVLDPDFETNHFFYVFYTAGTPNHDRVSRFTANASLTGTVSGSEDILYEDPQNANAEHHGGSLNFANDGTLLFTTGEHFDPDNSQDLTSPRGKVHRINPDGTVPTDDPFFDGVGPNWDSVWASGLRNPYRAYYDAPTGRYYIADVGGNDPSTAREEIDIGVAGANYGWPDSEGNCSSPCTSPVFSYPHNDRDAAITGGFVYHGTEFPARYRGAYFYADYTQNWIRGIKLDDSGNVVDSFNFEPSDGSTDGPYGDIVYLAEGPDGALYYVDLGYSDIGGTFGVSKIRRISYTSSNQAPVVHASASPTSGPTPLHVDFSSAHSSDPEGQPLTYSWDFGDGTTSTAANPTHTYSTRGPYQVRLTVSDGVQDSVSTPITINAGSVPTATILTPSNNLHFRAGDVISYSGDGTDPDDGDLPDSAFTWNIDFLHDGHVHPGTPVHGVTGGSFTIPSSGHDFSGNTRYRITLTVTDSDGLSSSRSVVVRPRKVNLTFDTVPSGRTIYLDGIAKTTPFVHDTLIGFHHTIEARNQTADGTIYKFDSWSDGGGQAHTITVPSTAHSYSATFNSSPVPPGLVGAWGFDEGDGTTVGDSSGGGHDGTLSGAGVSWDPAGKNGSALSFDGDSGNVTIPHASDISLASSFTLEAWVKPSTLSGYQTIVMKEETSRLRVLAADGGHRHQQRLQQRRLHRTPQRGPADPAQPMVASGGGLQQRHQHIQALPQRDGDLEHGRDPCPGAQQPGPGPRPVRLQRLRVRALARPARRRPDLPQGAVRRPDPGGHGQRHLAGVVADDGFRRPLQLRQHVARGDVPAPLGVERDGRRVDLPADVLRERASGVEATAGRDRVGGRHLRGHPRIGDPGAVEARVRLQQHLRVWMARVGEDVGGRPGLDDPPEVHDRHPVSEPRDHRELVGDEDHRQAEVAADLLEQRQELRLDRDVERADRLVGDQQPGVDRQRAGDRHPLALAARELVRVALDAPAAQPDALEQVGREALLIALLDQPVHQGRFGDGGADSQPRVERGVRVLVDHLDRAPHRAQLGALGGEHVGAVEGHRSLVRPVEADDAPGQGRLAAAGLADHAERLPWSELDVDVVEGGEHRRRAAAGPVGDRVPLGEALAESGDGQQRLGGAHAAPPTKGHAEP